MENKSIKNALISVYHKDGLEDIVHRLHELGVNIYSTGGTQSFIEELEVPVTPVENLTGYPSILDGRVKTLHPKIFGGILAKRAPSHLDQLDKYDIPTMDLVIVDLYPFEDTVRQTEDESQIIEKIDIGGISLIRAAAKNFNDVVIVPSRDDYAYFLSILKDDNKTNNEQRRFLAARAFHVSSHYDTAIYNYFNQEHKLPYFKVSYSKQSILRYGENPHQEAAFLGDLEDIFDILSGKALSYNNLIDIDAAMHLMKEFENSPPTFAVLKHNNACGIATCDNVEAAWDAALAGDPVSAFGGILIANTSIDLATATKIDTLFYEVLLAPDFDSDAFELLSQKKNRILLRVKKWKRSDAQFRSLLNGAIVQDTDLAIETPESLKVVTDASPTPSQIKDLLFAAKCTKHLKSNAIALVRDQQLLGMGCGQTSRVDALNQAIHKARGFGFNLDGAVMSSEAFFPFPDCVEIAHLAGIKSVIQPGGSVKDRDSISYCNEVGMSMVFSGTRHFKH